MRRSLLALITVLAMCVPALADLGCGINTQASAQLTATVVRQTRDGVQVRANGSDCQVPRAIATFRRSGVVVPAEKLRAGDNVAISVAPFSGDLQSVNVTTLTFQTPDGVLTLPLAAMPEGSLAELAVYVQLADGSVRQMPLDRALSMKGRRVTATDPTAGLMRTISTP